MGCQGWDLSLNHAGFAELDEDGHLAWYQYVTDKATQVKGKLGIRMKVEKVADKQTFNVTRLRWWADRFADVLLLRRPSHVAIEDYAPAAQSNSSYQIGELGGQARLAVMECGGPTLLRLHDPMSVKMYIAHNGLAKPEELAAAVFSRWPETEKAWGKLPKDAILDLCVAFGLSRMLFDEVAIRAGRLKLDRLHEKEVQVYNRITKANPVNLLGREFISR
jgi:Holliday junction resolvasome RuvABC endonuclease subunit